MLPIILNTKRPSSYHHQPKRNSWMKPHPTRHRKYHASRLRQPASVLVCPQSSSPWPIVQSSYIVLKSHMLTEMKREEPESPRAQNTLSSLFKRTSKKTFEYYSPLCLSQSLTRKLVFLLASFAISAHAFFWLSQILLAAVEKSG